MNDQESASGRAQKFRPADIARIIETAPEHEHPNLEDIKEMAQETLARTREMPAGPTREAMELEARLTIAEVELAQFRRG